MKNLLYCTISAITLFFGTFLFTSCEKQGDLKEETMNYQDSIFYDLEYGDLGLKQGGVIEDWD